MSRGDSNSTRSKKFYRPSVTYQLRKRGLDLINCTNGDMYEAMSKVTRGLSAPLEGDVLTMIDSEIHNFHT